MQNKEQVLKTIYKFLAENENVFNLYEYQSDYARLVLSANYETVIDKIIYELLLELDNLSYSPTKILNDYGWEQAIDKLLILENGVSFKGKKELAYKLIRLILNEYVEFVQESANAILTRNNTELEVGMILYKKLYEYL